MFSDKYPMMELNIDLICKLIKVLTLLYHQVKTQVIIKVHYLFSSYSVLFISYPVLFRMKHKRGRTQFMVLLGAHEKV